MIAEEHISLPPPNPFATLTGILLHPRATFQRLREQGGRAWIVVASLTLILALTLVLVQAPVSAEQSRAAIRAQLESTANPQSQEVPENALQQAESFTTNPIFTMLIPSVFAVVGLGLGWLLWAGALHLLSTMLGGSNSFGQMWQVVVWSWLPFALRSLVQTIYILVTRQLIQHPGLSGLVAKEQTTVGLFQSIPSSQDITLGYLLGKIDLYQFWNLALLVIGVMVMARFSGRKALLITLGIWVLFTLVGLAPQLISVGLSRGFTGG